ncbi:MAG TPA: hypothetical protein VNH83_17895, partial [Bryobacteraceae bacterium]|nr:hypothetical protein [Bryobacteraceae bacterium]
MFALLATAARADTLGISFSGYNGPYTPTDGVFVGADGIQGDPSPGFGVFFSLDGTPVAVCADACGLLGGPSRQLTLGGFEARTGIFTNAGTPAECEALGFVYNSGAGPTCLGEVFSSASLVEISTPELLNLGYGGYGYRTTGRVTLAIGQAFASYFGAAQGEYVGTYQLDFVVADPLGSPNFSGLPIIFNEQVTVDPAPEPSTLLLLGTVA